MILRWKTLCCSCCHSNWGNTLGETLVPLKKEARRRVFKRCAVTHCFPVFLVFLWFQNSKCLSFVFCLLSLVGSARIKQSSESLDPRMHGRENSGAGDKPLLVAKLVLKTSCDLCERSVDWSFDTVRSVFRNALDLRLWSCKKCPRLLDEHSNVQKVSICSSVEA